MKVGQFVKIKARKRGFYNAPKGIMYADPKYWETTIMPETHGVIDSIEKEFEESVYVVRERISKTEEVFHRVNEDEIVPA